MTPIERFARWLNYRRVTCDECGRPKAPAESYCSEFCADAAIDRTAY